MQSTIQDILNDSINSVKNQQASSPISNSSSTTMSSAPTSPVVNTPTVTTSQSGKDGKRDGGRQDRGPGTPESRKGKESNKSHNQLNAQKKEMKALQDQVKTMSDQISKLNICVENMQETILAIGAHNIRCNLKLTRLRETIEEYGLDKILLTPAGRQDLESPNAGDSDEQ